MNLERRLLWLLLISFAIRLLLAAGLELGNDEVYYTLYAERLEWNYFDHPPVIALLIRLTTAFSSHAFFVRLGAVFCDSGSAILVFFITRRWYNDRAALIATGLFSCSFYASVISGTFILPDCPELLCWFAAVWVMSGLTDSQGRHDKSPFTWILLGILIGVCALSKLSGIFLWLGLLGYFAISDRSQLNNPLLYLALTITMVVISPVYFWNLSHHWVTFSYHSGRVSWWRRPLQVDSFLQNLLGSVFYHNPVNILAMGLMFRSVVRKKEILPRHPALVWWISWPLACTVLLISLFNDTLPHWSGPAVASLVIPTSGWLAEKSARNARVWFTAAASVFVLVIAGGLWYFARLPFAFNSGNANRLGKGDIALDMTGWTGFSSTFDSLYSSDQSKGIMRPGSILLSDYWFPAGHLNYYVARPAHRVLLVPGPLHDVHQFAWKNGRIPLPPAGTDAYFIFPSNYYGPPAAKLRACFAGPLDSFYLPQKRSGITVRNFVVYRMRGLVPDSLSTLLLRFDQ